MINRINFYGLLLLMSIAVLMSCSKNNRKYAGNTVEYPENLTGNAAMAAYLASANTDYFENPKNRFASRTKVKWLLQQPMPTEASDQFTWNFNVASEYLFAGETEKAIQYFETAIALSDNAQLKPAQLYEAKSFLAISYLRLGEQVNCITNHVAESCILPIAGNAEYTIRNSTEKGIDLYLQLLKENPTDLNAMFLLNVAYMNLGMYPDSVPQEYRIAESKFIDAYPVAHFKNIAGNLGLDFTTTSGAACIDDFNNDGLLDIFTTGWFLDENVHYVTNNGDGTFTDRTQEAGLTGITGGLNAMQVDYNNDGWMDFFILRGAWWDDYGELPNSLLRNNGDNTFTDVTRECGLWSLKPTQTAAWADFNNDGWLDVFIGNESRKKSKEYLCELFISNGDGTFTEMSKKANVDKLVFAKGVTAGDYNNDGWMDIALSCNGMPNLLLQNNMGVTGKLSFEDVSEKTGIKDPIKSFPITFFDYNNDGWEDIFIMTYDANNCDYDNGAQYFDKPVRGEYGVLYKNNNGTGFTKMTKELGLEINMTAMGFNFGDLDNDGWLDLYVGTGTPNYSSLVPNRMLKNLNGEKFTEVTSSGGFGHLQKGHGIAWGDLDNDGDLDIYSDMGGGYQGDAFQSALFENPGTPNAFVQIKLVGKQANRCAIGSKVKITAKMKDGTTQDFYHVVSSGGSFGANSLQIEAGLGNAMEIVEVQILWAGSLHKESITQVPLNSSITIEEGTGVFTQNQIVPFTFPNMEHTQHHHF